MIKITNQKNNTIYYECDCGAKGMCSFKPMNRDAAIVISINCPVCKDTERVTLLQYSSEESKENLLNTLNEIDLSWVPTFTEEI
jgi:hypothetical protein